MNQITRMLNEVFIKAGNSVIQQNHSEISEEHIIYEILTQQNGLAKTIFSKLKLNIEIFIKLTQKLLNRYSTEQTQKKLEKPNFSKSFAMIFDKANEQKIQLQDEYLSTDHILLGLMKSEVALAKRFQELGLEYKKLKNTILEIRKGKPITDDSPENKTDTLNKFAKNLNELTKKGKLDPVIGREEEIRRTIQVLSRRTKNNPILIGEPGVGKTAIAEGLATKIIQADIPDSIKNKVIYSLDLGSMIAGAKYRGEFEERLKGLLDEIKESDGSIILFIDEIHTIVGAGAVEGSMDASNILKPMLARGELRSIGATTLKEYQKYIEKDAALERRFQPIYIQEPSIEETITILRGLKDRYEIHHGLKILDSALVAAAKLSDRYISDRFLPDKAVDLIDEASSKIRIEIDSMPENLNILLKKIQSLKIEIEALKKEKGIKNEKQLKEVQKKLQTKEELFKVQKKSWDAEKEKIRQMKQLKEEYEKYKNLEQEALRNMDYGKAAEFTHGKLPETEKKIRELNQQKNNSNLLKEKVTENDIAEIVSKWTGVPISKMLKNETDKFLNIESYLNKKIIGQTKATKLISEAIIRSKAGLSDHKRPIGVFLFLGPTGVGKTETAKALTEFLFNDRNMMNRFDMSEYMEAHSVAKLIGSPPGYIGYEEGGQLTEKIRKRPYSLILFDELEKAHYEIFNLFLQILDDGTLTDSKGRNVNFKNTLIIMTSNIGSEILIDLKLSLEEKERMVNEKLKLNFKPEFLNRVDEIIFFNNITKESLEKIVDLQLEELSERLKEKKCNVSFTKNLKDFIIENSFEPEYGARPIKRFIQRTIVNELSQYILKNTIKEASELIMDYEFEVIIQEKNKKQK